LAVAEEPPVDPAIKANLEADNAGLYDDFDDFGELDDE
jgi:hypothetical protein